MIVNFDEDRDERYSYMTTWLGEHQNESDMAFYSTYPFDNLVGPGIGRGEYGGFLMSLPARRMFDVWQDPDYDFAENKPERLLLAGDRPDEVPDDGAELRGEGNGRAGVRSFKRGRRRKRFGRWDQQSGLNGADQFHGDRQLRRRRWRGRWFRRWDKE